MSEPMLLTAIAAPEQSDPDAVELSAGNQQVLLQRARSRVHESVEHPEAA